jgi:sterol desaturase/sphingolipid hydroxylase (fatty acid hydroxylase superfamily)
MYSYATASYEILVFYFTVIFQFHEMHPDAPSGRLFKTIADLQTPQATPYQTPIQMTFRTLFNKKHATLQRSLRARLGATMGSPVRFESILYRSFAVRAVWIACILAAVWYQSESPDTVMLVPLHVHHRQRLMLLAIGLLQFIVAPMSLVVCLLRFCTNAMDCLVHYGIVCMSVMLVDTATAGKGSGCTICLNEAFALAFLGLDFCLNLLTYLRVSESFHPVRLLKHIAFGTFNTKTYYIVVFGVLAGLEVDLATWLLTSILSSALYCTDGVGSILRICSLPCFEILFYCEHRIGHCPTVYLHAHKMHHYLHDTTAFDAHIYGSGMNEEFIWILAEAVPCLICPGFFPYGLNFVTLKSSWTNKGGHTRTSRQGAGDLFDFDAANFHADHHTLHRANFGSSTGQLLDHYFGTAGPAPPSGYGKTYSFEPCAKDEPASAHHGQPDGRIVLRVNDRTPG